MNLPERRAVAVLDATGAFTAAGCGEPVIAAEIGVYRGEMSEAMLVLCSTLRLTLVDAWTPAEPGSAWAESRDPTARHSAVEYDAIRQEAHLRTTFAAHRRTVLWMPSSSAAMLYVNESMNFVFIDASHAYADVAADLSVWWPKVKIGGWLCGHDWDMPGKSWGVEQAVREQRAASVGEEIVVGDEHTWFVQRRVR